jgi:hypothetical protein
MLQFSASPPDAAVRLARSFAEKHGVDVWQNERGVVRLLARCRREGGDDAR